MHNLNERWKTLIQTGSARWCPGMLVRSGITMRLDWLDQDGRWNGAYSYSHEKERGGWLRVIEASMHEEWVPAWEDPATMGCLRALVREAWLPYGWMVWVQPCEDGYDWVIGWAGLPNIERTQPPPDRIYLTEAEALINMLEITKVTP